jgi:hypothetical protein
MDTPSVDIRKMLILFSGEKLIFIAHLRKKVDFFSTVIYVAEYIFAD